MREDEKAVLMKRKQRRSRKAGAALGFAYDVLTLIPRAAAGTFKSLL
ncbi:hypothetical protein [Sinobaca sp. H24]|nr:hypothetical protein [Sinobaca sp. H24]